MTNLKIKNFQQKLDIPKTEHKVLDFWDETNVFEQSVSSRPAKKRYVFYDGPPFATGLPHYGHILASTIKDVIPRYWTMKGYRVDRVWGWDCHGIPIENIVEQQLNLKGGKKDIEAMGIDKFNAACRAAIFKFDKQWEKVIHRIGRWVDFKNSYKTMDKNFMESVWWAFAELYKKDLVYQGRKVILYCPRCGTPLSNFEIAMDNSYKDVESHSVYVKFKVKGRKNQYLVAWTTTPWTLIGNVALAVHKDAKYVKVKIGTDELWVADKRKEELFQAKTPELDILETIKGNQLAGLEYEPLYSYMPLDGKKAHYVAVADFVSLEEGTGIVHTAAIFGEDDYQLALSLDLPRVPTLDDEGKFLDFVTPLKGLFYKKSEQWVVNDLTRRNLMYSSGKVRHSYPHCYRCGTQLYYSAIPAWFIDVQKLKSELKAQNQKINWYPGHLKHGRFGKGLETAPDWNISRSRYWGTPMPIWQSKSGKIRVIGSINELKKWAVKPEKVSKLTDIHREFLDDIQVWVNDTKTQKGSRISEVFDCWVESGSMPYASIHYPFENKQQFEDRYPAQFIAEYIAQTRAWFYTLHVMSVGLFSKPAFENAVTTGTILAEDGSKMSKSKKNFPDPNKLFEQYGVDALRFYLMNSPVMKAENLNFSEDQVKEIYLKFINIFWNVFSFYKLYPGETSPSKLPKPEHVLDKWIVSRTHSLIKQVTDSLDQYNTVSACRLLREFVTDLSTWYLRRSRDRLKSDKKSVAIFSWILKQLALVASPITPFITEVIYQNLSSSKQSIHLQSWPEADTQLINPKLEEQMNLARQLAEKAHAIRKAKKISLKQPLSSLASVSTAPLTSEITDVLAEELNVQRVTNKVGKTISAKLDLKITDELREKGKARELIREIQKARKQAGTRLDEQVTVRLPSWPKQFEDEIKQKTLAVELKEGSPLQIIRES